jgi:hypothetical protein
MTDYQQAMSSVLSEIELVLQQCIERRLCKDNALCRQPRFVLSPFIHAMVQQLVPGGVETLDVEKNETRPSRCLGRIASS